MTPQFGLDVFPPAVARAQDDVIEVEKWRACVAGCTVRGVRENRDSVKAYRGRGREAVAIVMVCGVCARRWSRERVWGLSTNGVGCGVGAERVVRWELGEGVMEREM